MFNSIVGSWQELPKMPSGNTALACGVATDANGRRSLVAAGGHGGGNDTWILNLDEEWEWRNGS